MLADGTLLRGDSGGGVALLAALSRSRGLGRALAALRLSSLVDALDRVLSRLRKHLGRFVPDGPALRRYP